MTIKMNKETTEAPELTTHTDKPPFSAWLIFLLAVIVLPAIVLGVNFVVFPPPAPTWAGVGLVYAGYIGAAAAYYILGMLPLWTYRAYLKLRKRKYTRSDQLIPFVIGLVLVLNMMKSDGII